MLKIKAQDGDALDVGESLAQILDHRVAAAYTRWRHRLGLVGSADREVIVYQQPDPRFVRHVPRVLGSTADGPDPTDDDGTRAIVLEMIRAAAGTADVGRAWPRRAVDAAIDGLASLHAVWFDREGELAAEPWIGHVRTPSSLRDMADLWQALADHASRVFAAFDAATGATVAPAQQRIVDRVHEWTRFGGRAPRTLIHNDFNPRNIRLRAGGGLLRLCAFDWELATIGRPQRDLAELLCFTLSDGATRGDVDRWLERHRRALARETGADLDPREWREGFRAALYELMLDRLPFYALVHRVKPQHFLSGVVRSWLTLYRMYPLEG
jgi:aminoglycoside phosphotransferase (APT) family kinase protein